MFNSVEATDQKALNDSKKILLRSLEDEELKKYFLPSQFCIFSSDDHTYGPYGTDSIGRKPVTIPIGNGDVLDQATSSFIYKVGVKTFKNDKCFSFYVSNKINIQGVAGQGLNKFNRVWFTVDFSYVQSWSRTVMELDWFKIKTSEFDIFLKDTRTCLVFET